MTKDPRPLVVRNGLVVDGTGAPGRVADVAISDGVITEVGRGLDTAGADVIDADGLVVTPGFVDIHTHFDGQATWDPLLAPSSLHGVTSVAMGNCGVGFAPAKPTPEQHDWLIGMLEGVEDIPGHGARRGPAVGLGDVPRLPRRARPSPLRGRRRHPRRPRPAAGVRDGRARRRPQRGADRRRAAGDGRAPSSDGVRAGALGFTTSRTVAHRTRDGAPLGTRFSTADELLALVGAMAETGQRRRADDLRRLPERGRRVRPRGDGADALDGRAHRAARCR